MLEEDVSITQLQWKSGFAWTRTSLLPPTLLFAQSEPLFGSSRVKLPGLCFVGVCFLFFFFFLAL